MFFYILVQLLCFSPALLVQPEFNDRLMYEISWNEQLTKQAEEQNAKENVLITTKENEKYECLLPTVETDEESNTDVSLGPSPEVLIADVLMGPSKRCSYRLEPYWTYELCHGQYITQYHEEKELDRNVKRDEFMLGKLTTDEVKELLSVKPLEKPTAEKRKVPVRKIDNRDTPYYSVEMSNGTPCDLSSGKPRKATVLYICHTGSNNEVMNVKEVTTCEYEVIVLTPSLCANLAYRVKTNPVNDIKCHPLSGSPSRPMALVQQEPLQISSIVSELLAQEKQETLMVQHSIPPSQSANANAYIDQAINEQFLRGSYCLIGGSGWWQYEFCHGKYVNQFHVEPNKPKVVINLGHWNKGEHIKWSNAKKTKRKTKNHVVHFYSGGDICNPTGKPRIAQVMLTCKPGSGQQLSIYMTEDAPCQYSVGVESPILCPLIQEADEHGLFPEYSSITN